MLYSHATSLHAVFCIIMFLEIRKEFDFYLYEISSLYT